MNARYYVPGVGRFASADSLVPAPASPQSFNRYSYVYNNPLNATDPSGHCPWCIVTGAIGGGVTGATYYWTTPAAERNLGDALVVVGTGFIGGALIGSGVGAASGAAIMSTALATNTAALIGAGTGAIVASETYLLTTDQFDRSDFLITSGGGALDGALVAHPALGGTGVGAVTRRALTSGGIATVQSISQNVANQEPVDLVDTAYTTGFTMATVGISELFTGGFSRSDWRAIDRSVPWQPTRSFDSLIDRRAIRQSTISNTQAVIRSGLRNTAYGWGADYFDRSIISPMIQ